MLQVGNTVRDVFTLSIEIHPGSLALTKEKKMAPRKPKVFAACLLFGGLVAFGPQPALADTVFHYKFEGSPVGGPIPTLVDSGPNLLNGTITGLKYQSPGPGGGLSAANARGDSNYATVGSNAAMNVQEFTLSVDAFVTGNGFGNPGGGVGLVAKRYLFTTCNVCDSWGIDFDSATNRFKGHIAQTFNGVNGTAIDLISTDTFLRNEWHTVSLSLARNVSGSLDRLQLHVDGVLEGHASGNWADIPFYNGPLVGNSYSDLLIGAGNYGGAGSQFRRNFDGDIDNVSLTTPVPEPETYAMMLAGLGLLGFIARRRKQHSV